MKLNITYSLLLCLLVSALNTSLAQDDSTIAEPIDPIAEELSALNVQDSSPPKIKRPKQDPIKIFDMGVYSTQKAFKSRKVKRHSMWERIENDCGLDLEEIPIELSNAFNHISRNNQSSLYDLVKGNVKISNQIISPTERQFMHSPFLTPGSSSKIFGCLTGMSYREENFILNNVGYFDLVLSNLAYLKEELQYNYHKNGRTYQSIILRTKNDIDYVLNDPTKIGFLVSIGGGHSLGNYLYIEQDQVDTDEYQNIILTNINKLKGITPIEKDPAQYLDIPIFSINFGNFFKDGICGKTSRFSLNEEEAFKRPTTIDDDITSLGQKAIARLLNKKKGRRILIDVGGMSLRSREWYYKYIKDQRYRNDTIPIIATGVGVSGLSKKDNAYGRDDKRELLSHQFSNMCRQDLTSILQSQGLIALSLDKNKLMGKEFQRRYDEAIPNSADRRRIAIEAIVGNICKAIHMSNDIEAWNMICISSQFDSHARHLDVFDSSSDMVNLYRDLLEFFKNPRDIKGLYSVKEIENFMYNFTPEEVVNKIMYENALTFIKRNLPEIEPETP
ncbi:hypothetical protein [Aureispira anguillae]|uniref:Uncharacterized protein n=1 Tax=Aureispira anguillae TaxID=2864201 RepID=A0A916DSM6_9BACT|nr:hypothetical protein [Aureispira anguillae]BDS12624.1 hypothetical protein AsAng_0033480 [Aureispira anguillae]